MDNHAPKMIEIHLHGNAAISITYYLAGRTEDWMIGIHSEILVTWRERAELDSKCCNAWPHRLTNFICEFPIVIFCEFDIHPSDPTPVPSLKKWQPLANHWASKSSSIWPSGCKHEHPTQPYPTHLTPTTASPNCPQMCFMQFQDLW